MTSSRVPRWSVSSAKVMLGRRGNSAASSSTASETLRVSTVTWERSILSTARSSVARRKARASLSGVTPANRSGAWTTNPSSRPAWRGRDRDAASVMATSVSATAA
jgi:hypothetical protein